MSIQDEGEDYNQRLDRARDDVVESHYGNFTDCLETRSSTDMDGLRVGQLKINGDETMMKKFGKELDCSFWIVQSFIVHD